MNQTPRQPDRFDFAPLHAAIQRWVDGPLLPGLSHALLLGREVVDSGCIGWADREAQVPLRTDHIFRAFSNTKLVTSCAALLLHEEGRFGLDDPIGEYLPQLARPVVLRPGATSLADTEPARGPITVRQLMSHSAGLSYGLLDPGSLLFEAYTAKGLQNPLKPLSELVDLLAELPLAYQPGTAWEYSMATDVLARLIEVLSGQRLGDFFQQRIFDPLGMVDTGFALPESKHGRLARLYAGASLRDPLKPGLSPLDDMPWPGAYLRPVPRQSGGGGLVTTLADMVALVRSLLPGGPTLLQPQTLALMMSNQLPPGVHIRFPASGELVGRGHGLAGSVTLAPLPMDPPQAAGELQWGGMAGTHWWISPRTGLSGIVMTQRHMAFSHPFAFEFKQLAYRAVLGGG